MSSETKSRAGAEALAKAFHEAYERLAPQFGYETRKASAVAWEQVPERNRNLMIAVCAELESSASADTRGREAHLTQEQVKEIIAPYINLFQFRDCFEIVTDRINAALREPGADPGTTGAEGLPIVQSLYDKAKQTWNDASPDEVDYERYWYGRMGGLRDALAATQRAPVTPPEGGIPKWLWEPFCDANGIPLKCSICGSDIPRIDNGWHGDAEGKVVQHIECSYQQQIKELQAKLATPAPVTTPGRDEALEALIKKWRGPFWSGLQSDEVNRERQLAKQRCADELEEALAAAKEPRG